MSRSYHITVQQGRIFLKGKDILISNFREHELTIFNKIFQTPDAAYQYAKAVFSNQIEIAQAIFGTKTGVSAKTIADKNISPNSDWYRAQEKVMEHNLNTNLK